MLRKNKPQEEKGIYACCWEAKKRGIVCPNHPQPQKEKITDGDYTYSDYQKENRCGSGLTGDTLEAYPSQPQEEWINKFYDEFVYNNEKGKYVYNDIECVPQMINFISNLISEIRKEEREKCKNK